MIYGASGFWELMINQWTWGLGDTSFRDKPTQAFSLHANLMDGDMIKSMLSYHILQTHT
jgi:hypothetical protein